MIEAACESAMKKVLRISDVSPRRLMSISEVAAYLSLSEREAYNMLSNEELTAVRHGRRVMVDIWDVDRWIAEHKTK
jgi:excisionase family DNA binding protein